MKRIVLVATGLLVACGGSSTQNANYKQEQTPVTPTGTIVGRVVDMSTYAPLDGVAVKAIGADTTALTTNADGVFVLKNAVVSSTYLFVMEKPGYLRQTASASIAGSTGNSPLAGSVTAFNAQLYKADGEVRGNVFLPNGQPAANATVVIDNRASGYGDAVATTTTDAAGFFKLTGIASSPRGLNTTVAALWYDENNDQLADYGTTQANVAVYPGVIERVFLTYNSVGQRVIASNVSDAELGPSDDIQFTLAMPVLSANLNQSAYRAFVLTNTSRGGVEVATEATWSSAVQVSVHPTIPLREGDRYNIALALTNANGGGSNAGPNFFDDFDFQVRSPNISGITDQVANFSVTNANITPTRGPRSFDFNSNSFTLTWDQVANAVSYAVYAKDTLYNPDWVQIRVISPQNYPRYTTSVSLPSSFDPNNTGRLSLGNRVTFTVVPIDVYGNMSPLNSAPTQVVSDNVPPTAVSMNMVSPAAGTLDAANDETTPLQIVFRLTYSEAMDPITMPSFTTVASNVTSSFVWDNYASNSGLLTVTVPPGVDATGPFTVRGGRDMASNPLLNNDFNGGLSGRKELGTNWNFEDASGTCALTGWSGSSTGGGTNPVTVANSSSRGRCAAVIGTLPGATPTTGISRLYQDVTLPSLANTPGWSIEARVTTRLVYYQSSGGFVGVTQRCGIADTTNTFLALMRGSASENNTTYTLSTTAASGFANTTVRLLCEVNNPSATIPSNTAIYADDFSISMVKTGSGWFQ